MMQSRRAVFLDRDGVLNDVVVREGKPESPRLAEELVLVPDLDEVNRLSDAGLLVFIITNQPDVKRGRISHAAMQEMIGRIRGRVRIDDVRVCLHDDEDNCDCRKPKPGMILDLAQGWRVALDQSFVIGDMWRDVDAARVAGCRAVLIRRDYNRDVQPDVAVDSLGSAVDEVLRALDDGR